MHLKRLEVTGFKSFAAPLDIDFNEGITSIVGPNGSGKSNVADGIRWVLGEQSAKQLRGAKMEDVIFAGSDSRKRVNIAEVSLILDNEDEYMMSDFSEISLTRRLYRTGESEYFLNRKPCRRKDIVDLLVDSGLGKDAYSMIGQGEVDQILSSKPEDRRTIFEDAAGVLKYKSRKYESEKKLQETLDNLNRVQDILYELEEQLTPLEQQASTAKEYLQHQEEKERLDIGILVHDIEEKHASWQEYKESLADIEKEWQTEKQNLDEEKGALSRQKETLAHLESELDTRQNEWLETSEALQQQEGHRNLMVERGSNAHERLDELDRRIRELQQAWEEKRKQLDEETETLNEKISAEQQNNEQLQAIEQRLNKSKADVEKELEDLKGKYIDALNTQAASKNELRYTKEQQERIQGRLERLLSQNEGEQERLEDQVREEEKAKRECEEIEERLQTENQSYEQAQTHLTAVQEDKNDAEQKLYANYRKGEDARSRLQLLQRMDEEHAGFYQGVKAVLQAGEAQKLAGIHGAVGALIATEQRFEKAVETALGATMQHVIVEQEKDARQAIQFLKMNRQGRATFLPRTVMKPRYIPGAVLDRLRGDEGFCGVAAHVLTVDERFANVIENLLGHVVLAVDLESGNRLANMVQYRNRIVTLDGEVINPGGSMTGGSDKRKGMELLSRQREQEELEEKLKQLDAETEKLEKNVAAVKKKVETADKAVSDHRQTVDDLRTRLAEAKEAHVHLQAESGKMNSELSLYRKEKESLEAEQAQWAEQMRDLEAKVARETEENERLQADIDAKEKEKEEQEESEQALQEEFTQLRIQAAARKEQMDSQRQTVDRLKSDVAAEQKDLQAATKERENLEQRLQEVEGGSDSLDQEIEQLKQRKSELEQQIDALKQQREEQQRAIEKKEHQLSTLENRVAAAEENRYQLQVSYQHLDMELDQRLERLQADYEISYEAARQRPSFEEETVEDARKRLKLVQKSIDELGSVNIGAIDEYERVNERYQFLTEQQADLTEGRDTLITVIREMDEEMTRKFNETFALIRTYFQETFTAMFGGGEADLLLEDPDDLLETGINIYARPPGKKRQSLSLLSGGEKSLTAIALLFAILHVRPVPFCVLDEVEASLDEANVDRFANYLRTFSSQTQFIVITHRKGTMIASDILYGVTMEESGVSRLVSVKLEDYAYDEAEGVLQTGG
ncbi:chromosome segregation protein SMC [Natribacillus halophilus]|uniref:Chromosome partition protein Smc n=1 Tax=Natribacillus halophilus TaxID=549003 RepID=A0A1G8MIX7_9BACI|nr:chromosome segregation protein SMC [Natribacillus halophilus]SDI67834.1 condensin subunit Smc [Natribacillus halophilus]